MNKNNNLPEDTYFVFIEDCHYQRVKTNLRLNWLLRIIEGPYLDHTIIKYNTLNSEAAAGHFLGELCALGESAYDFEEFRDVPERLKGKECYVNYRYNDEGYPHIEICFNKTADLYIDDAIVDIWRQYFRNKSNNGKK